MKGYADIADLTEDDRIRIIGQRAETGVVLILNSESGE